MPQIFELNEFSCNQIHQAFGQGIKTLEDFNERKDFYGFHFFFLRSNI